MAVRITQRLPEGVGIEQYDAVSEKVNAEGPPDGNLAHSAGEEGGRLVIVDLWESPEHYQRFVEERLRPAIDEVSGGQAPEAEEPQIVELHNFQVP